MDQEGLSCNICSGTLKEDNNTWVLSCGHVLCSSCIDEDLCPKCVRDECLLPSGNVYITSPASTPTVSFDYSYIVNNSGGVSTNAEDKFPGKNDDLPLFTQKDPDQKPEHRSLDSKKPDKCDAGALVKDHCQNKCSHNNLEYMTSTKCLVTSKENNLDHSCKALTSESSCKSLNCQANLPSDKESGIFPKGMSKNNQIIQGPSSKHNICETSKCSLTDCQNYQSSIKNENPESSCDCVPQVACSCKTYLLKKPGQTISKPVLCAERGCVNCSADINKSKPDSKSGLHHNEMTQIGSDGMSEFKTCKSIIQGKQSNQVSSNRQDFSICKCKSNITHGCLGLCNLSIGEERAQSFDPMKNEKSHDSEKKWLTSLEEIEKIEKEIKMFRPVQQVEKSLEEIEKEIKKFLPVQQVEKSLEEIEKEIKKFRPVQQVEKSLEEIEKEIKMFRTVQQVEKSHDSEKKWLTSLEEIEKKIKMFRTVQQVDTLKHHQADVQLTGKGKDTPHKTRQNSGEDSSDSDVLKLSLESLEKLQLNAKIAKITSTIAQTLTEVDKIHASAKQTIEEKLIKDDKFRCRCGSRCSDLDHFGATSEKSCGDAGLRVSLTTKSKHSSATEDKSSNKDVSYVTKNEHSTANDKASEEITFNFSHVAKMECTLSECGGPKKIDTSSFITSMPLSNLVSKLPFGPPTMYQPNIGTDLMKKNDSLILIQTKWEIITAMDEFKDKSLEELRLKHYSEHANSFFRFGQNSFSFCNGKFSKDNAQSGFHFPKGSQDYPSFPQVSAFNKRAETFFPKTVDLHNAFTSERNPTFDSSLNQASEISFSSVNNINPKYSPTVIDQLIIKNGTQTLDKGEVHAITLMKEYELQSFEELRYNHTMDKRKPKGTSRHITRKIKTRRASRRNSSDGTLSPLDKTTCTFPQFTAKLGEHTSSFSTKSSEHSSPFGNISALDKSSGKLYSEEFFCKPAPRGTAVKFCPTISTDVTVMPCVRTTVRTSIEVITAMFEYMDKSLEELRLEDYLSNRKG